MIFFLGYHFDTLYCSNEQENKEQHERKKLPIETTCYYYL